MTSLTHLLIIVVLLQVIKRRHKWPHTCHHLTSLTGELSTVVPEKENSLVQSQLDDIFGASNSSSLAGESSRKPHKRKASDYLPTPKYTHEQSEAAPPKTKKVKTAPWVDFSPLSPQQLSYYIFTLTSDLAQVVKDLNGLRNHLKNSKFEFGSSAESNESSETSSQSAVGIPYSMEAASLFPISNHAEMKLLHEKLKKKSFLENFIRDLLGRVKDTVGLTTLNFMKYVIDKEYGKTFTYCEETNNLEPFNQYLLPHAMLDTIKRHFNPKLPPNAPVKEKDVTSKMGRWFTECRVARIKQEPVSKQKPVAEQDGNKVNEL